MNNAWIMLTGSRLLKLLKTTKCISTRIFVCLFLFNFFLLQKTIPTSSRYDLLLGISRISVVHWSDHCFPLLFTIPRAALGQFYQLRALGGDRQWKITNKQMNILTANVTYIQIYQNFQKGSVTCEPFDWRRHVARRTRSRCRQQRFLAAGSVLANCPAVSFRFVYLHNK